MSQLKNYGIPVDPDALRDAGECLAWQHRWERVGPIRASGRGTRSQFQVDWRCDQCGSERSIGADVWGRYDGQFQYRYSLAFRQVQRADLMDGYTRKESQRGQWFREVRKDRAIVIPLRQRA